MHSLHSLFQLAASSIYFRFNMSEFKKFPFITISKKLMNKLMKKGAEIAVIGYASGV